MRVACLQRPLVAGLQRGAVAEIERMREDVGAVLAGDRRRRVARSVIDDQHVQPAGAAAYPLDHAAEPTLLVECRNHDHSFGTCRWGHRAFMHQSDTKPKPLMPPIRTFKLPWAPSRNIPTILK